MNENDTPTVKFWRLYADSDGVSRRSGPPFGGDEGAREREGRKGAREREGRKGHRCGALGDEPAVLMIVQFNDPAAAPHFEG